ncbi:transposase, partial [Streptomyces sp. NPDC049099]|uniref:transposase n=1 Tax=Streptomyces sp. NPDC049099 TaxID=3155768 RepID=UPI0034306697
FCFQLMAGGPVGFTPPPNFVGFLIWAGGNGGFGGWGGARGRPLDHDRRLYFTKEWAGDDERSELTGVPDELSFAIKPQLAADTLRNAGRQGISASFLLGDEVYSGAVTYRLP